MGSDCRAGQAIGGRERRRYLRLAPGRELECRIEGHQVVHVVGMSSSGPGMRLITDRPLPAGEIFSLCLDPRDGDPPLDLRARVVWQDSWDFEFCSRFVVGVEFEDLDARAGERLARLLPSMDRNPVK